MRRMVCVFLIVLAPAVRAVADPPERVARISFLGGAVSFRTSTVIDWSPAVLNYPLTLGDHVWTDRDGRLEVEMGATAVNLDASTALSVLNLDRRIVQLRLLQGSAIVRVHELADDESIEVDTPHAAMTVLGPGLYRIDVSASGDATAVTVRRGDAEVAAGASVVPVHVGQRVTMSGDEGVVPTAKAAEALDEFDDWVAFRDRRAEALTSVRYVPRGIVGYEDLDEFGTWRVAAEYGPVWVPHVRPGWVPYRFGHWAWVDPWGWTWIDDAPWGFAPFHYGRWAYVGSGWVWVPGTFVARPVYAPALVAFVGGSNWRMSVSIGEPIGWFPLGPREVFVPSYTASPVYLASVNRPHVSVIDVNVNVTNITYVNRAVPGAVTVVSRTTFAESRPVAGAAIAAPAGAVGAVAVVGHAAPREIMPIAAARAAAVAAPPPTIVNRTVMVRTAPPAVVSSTTEVRRAVPASAVPVRAPATQTPPPPAPRASATQPRPAALAQVTPNRAEADLVLRHAAERAAIEAQHAAERADLQARHQAELRAAATTEAQADVRARHTREQAELDGRQKREHEQLQKRQESERRRP